MAKQFIKKEQERKLKYPSDYGSHKSMINKEATEKLNDEEKVVCTDDLGDYITEKYKIDNGLADVNRYSR